jgi:predicted  nucleic acid-binding Zn-ribbon protein
VISTAWPRLIEAAQEEAVRPLNRRIADLQQYMQTEQERHTDLEDTLEDLRSLHEDLKELCKARGWALRTTERECDNWAKKAHNLNEAMDELHALVP